MNLLNASQLQTFKTCLCRILIVVIDQTSKDIELEFVIVGEVPHRGLDTDPDWFEIARVMSRALRLYVMDT